MRRAVLKSNFLVPVRCWQQQCPFRSWKSWHGVDAEASNNNRQRKTAQQRGGVALRGGSGGLPYNNRNRRRSPRQRKRLPSDLDAGGVIFFFEELASKGWQLEEGTVVAGLTQYWKRKGDPADPRLRLLWDMLFDCIPSLTERSVGRVMVACRHLRVRDPDLWEPLCDRAKELVEADAFEPMGISSMLLAMAQIGYEDPDLVQALSTLGLQQLENFNPQDVSNTLSALKKFEHIDQNFLEGMLDQATFLASEFNGAELTGLLNALAVLNIKENELLRTLCTELGKWAKVRSLQPREIATVLNSLARLEFEEPRLVSLLCNKAKAEAGKFPAISIALTLHALRRLKHDDRELLGLLLNKAFNTAKYFDSRSISLTLAAMVQFNLHHANLLDRLCEQAMRKAHHFTPNGVAETLCAIAHFGHRDKALVQALCQRARKIAGYFRSATTIRMVVTALSQLGHEDPALMRRLKLKDTLLGKRLVLQGKELPASAPVASVPMENEPKSSVHTRELNPAETPRSRPYQPPQSRHQPLDPSRF